MVGAGLARYTPHALVSTVVFESMHIADELAENWAPFTPFNDPVVGMVGMGIFTFVAMVALWGVLTDRRWGFALAAFVGLFFLVTELWHPLDPANMNRLRWAVVLLSQASGLVVLLLGVTGVRAHGVATDEGPPASDG